MASLMEMGLCKMSMFNGVVANDLALEGGMVVYATGPKGSGKTTLLAHLGGEQMLPPIADTKVWEAQEEAARLRQKSHKNVFIPDDVQHLVYSDIEIQTCKDQGYLPRYSWDLDVDRMQVPDEKNTNVQFFPWGATAIIDELMEKFDARDHAKKDSGLPPGMRKFLQFCRHRGILILTGCLLASGSDKRFRQMSQNILLIVHRTDKFINNELVQTTWYCLEFSSSEACDKFLENKEKKVFSTPRIFIHDGNIRNCVNSYAENDAFIKGLEDKNIEFKRGRNGN